MPLYSVPQSVVDGTHCKIKLVHSESPLYEPKITVVLDNVYERLENDHVKTMGKFITKYFGKAKLSYRIVGSTCLFMVK